MALLRSGSKVPDRSALEPFTVPGSLRERFEPFHEHFESFVTFLRPETVRNVGGHVHVQASLKERITVIL